MKIKNLVEESIKEVSQKINVLSIGELSKEKIALIDEYSNLNKELININMLINRIEEHEKEKLLETEEKIALKILNELNGSMKLEEKINILKGYGYIELTDEHLENVKLKDFKNIYEGIKESIKLLKENGEESKLIIYFNDSFCIYTDVFINERTVEEILKGTIRLLNDFSCFS